jgi:signal transduction histidine kinase
MTTPVHWLDRLAHDLRGPLMPLQTAAHLLRSGQVEGERQQELFAVIERQTRQLVHMIDELGDWTRTSQGRLLGLRELSESSLLLDYARVGSGAVGAAALVDDRAGAAVVQGDPVRLTQMLRILIEYVAARGNAPARIALQTASGRLRIDVRDAGPPPDPAQLAVLLEEPQAEPYDQGTWWITDRHGRWQPSAAALRVAADRDAKRTERVERRAASLLHPIATAADQRSALRVNM